MIFNPPVRVIENRKILADLYHIKLQCETIAATAKPGNFVQIKVSTGYDPIFRRPMSIHSSNADCFEMIFRRVGKGTNILAQAEPDQEFDMLGPLGNSFDLPAEDEIAVMVSGGVGFPPLHFFSQELIAKHNFPQDQILFLFGIKDETEKIIAEDVLKLGVETIFSTDDGSYGFPGLVTELFEETYKNRLRDKKIKIYSCGPNPMMQRLSQIALGFRLPCQLSLEGGMPCGVGTCLGCAAKKRGQDDYFRVCQDGPVFKAEDVEL